MPVSEVSSRLVYDALKGCGVRLLSVLPETWLVHLVSLAEADSEMTLVRLAKEEEGVGVSVGAHLAGVRSAMLMQNHGLLASVNAIVSLAQLYRVPLLMLASYRGGFGEEHPWQTEGGGVTEDLLHALRVPYLLLEQADQAAVRLRQAQALAEASLRPVALLLCRGLMWED
jgi:sulfopyruvate decarboxylase subunit alpha